jgi:hypothetical protein
MNLRNNPVKQEHVLEFMKKLFNRQHAEIAQVNAVHMGLRSDQYGALKHDEL